MTFTIQKLIGCAALASLLGACAGPDYKCPIPEGSGGCRSVDAVYHHTQTLDNTDTPSAGSNIRPDGSMAPASEGKRASEDDGMTKLFVAAGNMRPPLETPSTGAALVSAPRVIRIYVAPWQDLDGDFEGGGYLYLRLDKGQWTIPQ